MDMANRIKELEEHIKMLRKNSMESTKVLLKYLLQTLEEKKTLEDALSGKSLKIPVTNETLLVNKSNDNLTRQVSELTKQLDVANEQIIQLNTSTKDSQRLYNDQVKELLKRNEELEYFATDNKERMELKVDELSQLLDAEKKEMKLLRAKATDTVVAKVCRIDELTQQYSDIKEENKTLKQEIVELRKTQANLEREKVLLREELKKSRNIVVRGCHRFKKRWQELTGTA